MRVAIVVSMFVIASFSTTMFVTGQETPKIKTSPTPIVETIPFVPVYKYEKKEEEKEPQIIRLTVDVPMEAKIAINGKLITYSQFTTLMEFAGNAFKIEEMVWRGGRLETVKLSVKE